MAFILLSNDSFFEFGIRSLFNSAISDCVNRRTIIIVDIKYLPKINLDINLDQVSTIIFMMENIEDRRLFDKKLINYLSTICTIHFISRNATPGVCNALINMINKGDVKNRSRINQPIKRALLTSMESHVLSLLLQGNSLCYIAEMSALSVKTISAHKRSIMKKINVKNIPKLVEKIVFKQKADNLLLELSRAKLDLVQCYDFMLPELYSVFSSTLGSEYRKSPELTKPVLHDVSTGIPAYLTTLLHSRNVML